MLDRLKTLKRPIRATVIGMGAMGKGLVYQCRTTPGFECVAVADLDVKKAVDALKSLDAPHRVVSTTSEAQDAVAKGLTAVFEDGEALCRLEGVDAMIESTSSIEAGGRYATTALEHKQHVILMNAEIDLIFGPHFTDLARRNGVVCTSCDGDQHGVIKRLVDEMELWGFAPVMGGNIKGFLDRYSDPTKIVPEADKRNLDYKMCTAYTDGTKLNIEMALVANALGYRTDTPGMHGPRLSSVAQVLDHFDFARMRKGPAPVVDYILGAEPGGGVYAVGYNDHPYQRGMMEYYKMGKGPFYLFYRPYHLCHVEALRGIASAVLDGETLLEPSCGFRTNVTAYAKKNLRAGENLDGLGGYACYGLIENCADGAADPGLPICLAENVTLRRDVPRDGRISMADITPPERDDFRLYRLAQEVSGRPS